LPPWPWPRRPAPAARRARRTSSVINAPGRVWLRLAAAEQALDVGELQLDIGGPTVIALAGMRRRLHLAQQRIHLLGGQAPPGADAAVAGERAADVGQLLLER